MRRIKMISGATMYIGNYIELSRYSKKLGVRGWYCSLKTELTSIYSDYVLMCYPRIRTYQIVSAETGLYRLSLEIADNKI